jgi:hypothetical protein
MKRIYRPITLVLAALALLVMPPGQSRAAEEAPYKPRPRGTLTFTRDVAPLMFKHCATCHRPGEVAPFSLLEYRDVKKRAALIGKVTASRFMPPWKPVAGHGEFRDARRLGGDEIGLLKQWADEGAVQGDPKHLPPKPTFPTGWQLGKPDLVVTMPKTYTVPAEGADIYRNFVIPFSVPEGKYIRAVEFRPSNRRVVHHAILAFDPSGKMRQRDGKDGAPGFTQSNVPGIVLPGSLAFWVPGKDSRPLPEGVSMSWPKGADLVLQLHVHPSGKAEVERSTIGFYFTSQPPRRSLNIFLVQNKNIDIPAGKSDYQIEATKTLSADALVYGIFPHMHMIGKEVRVTAELPGGAKKSLLWIDRWDFNWQGYYEYAKPVSLPKGTKVHMQCKHDNSASNPSNPNQPPKRVTYGEQTTNEMAIVLMHVMAKPGAAGTGKRDFLKEAKELIRRHDRDGDGKLSAEEIARILKEAKEAKELIKKFDKDGDGKLDAAELAEVLRARAKR